MKVAICDDTYLELKTTEKIITEYANTNNMQIEIETFNDPQILLNKLKYFEKTEYDVFLLDIIMQENGIDVAEKINKIYPDAVIIFTTTSREFAVDAFRVRAYNYLVKPLEKAKVFECLNQLLLDVNLSHKTIIKFKTDDFSLISIDIKKIAYIESCDRRMVINLIDKSQITSPSIRTKFLDSIPFEYENYHFVNCHSSYIVNMNHIKAIDNNSFIMKTGKQIPISKRLYTTVKEKYIKYLLGE